MRPGTSRVTITVIGMENLFGVKPATRCGGCKSLFFHRPLRLLFGLLGKQCFDLVDERRNDAITFYPLASHAAG